MKTVYMKLKLIKKQVIENVLHLSNYKYTTKTKL